MVSGWTPLRGNCNKQLALPALSASSQMIWGGTLPLTVTLPVGMPPPLTGAIVMSTVTASPIWAGFGLVLTLILTVRWIQSFDHGFAPVAAFQARSIALGGFVAGLSALGQR